MKHYGLSILVPLVVVALVAPSVAHAQSVTTDLNAGLPCDDLANTLVGAGITISNVTCTANTQAAAKQAMGTFTGGTGIIGFGSGVILSSGAIAGVVGPNTSDGLSITLRTG